MMTQWTSRSAAGRFRVAEVTAARASRQSIDISRCSPLELIGARLLRDERAAGERSCAVVASSRISLQGIRSISRGMCDRVWAGTKGAEADHTVLPTFTEKWPLRWNGPTGAEHRTCDL